MSYWCECLSGNNFNLGFFFPSETLLHQLFPGHTVCLHCVVTGCSLVTLTIWIHCLCGYRVFSGYTDHLVTLCGYRVFPGYIDHLVILFVWLQGAPWLHGLCGYRVFPGYTVCMVTGCSLLTSRIVNRSRLLPTGAKRWSLPISWQSSAMVEVSFYSLPVQTAMPLNKSKVTLEFSHATVNFLSLPVWLSLPLKKLKVTGVQPCHS